VSTLSSDTATVPPQLRQPDGALPWWHALLRWESALVVIFIGTLFFGAAESTHFLTRADVFFIGLNSGEIAIMALPLTLIVMTGEIDLSVASMMGLASTMLGYFYEHHWPIAVAMIACLVIGAIGGAFNGFLVTKLGLPSIAVTIGTLALFRGIAEIVLGSKSVVNFPKSLTNVGVKAIPHTQLSYSAGIFIVLAIIFGVVLHATPLGRSIVAIGLQSEAAFFAGIRVKRIKFLLYVLSGSICALAGMLLTFRLDSARYDNGLGLELNVVAIVLFGGVSIFGGRGTIFGVLIAVLVFGCITEALTLMNISAQAQSIVTGGLLLISVILPNLADGIRRIRTRRRMPHLTV
jgi:rhamnose transport system permease protein